MKYHERIQAVKWMRKKKAGVVTVFFSFKKVFSILLDKYWMLEEILWCTFLVFDYNLSDFFTERIPNESPYEGLGSDAHVQATLLRVMSCWAWPGAGDVDLVAVLF